MRRVGGEAGPTDKFNCWWLFFHFSPRTFSWSPHYYAFLAVVRVKAGRIWGEVSAFSNGTNNHSSSYPGYYSMVLTRTLLYSTAINIIPATM